MAKRPTAKKAGRAGKAGGAGKAKEKYVYLFSKGKTDGNGGDPEAWSMQGRRAGLNHVAIAWPDRESWLKQVAYLQSKGVAFHRRVNHGMTHSVYISDPDGHGIEALYELPREVWEGDIQGAQNYAEQLPTEGEAALIDRTDNPVFSSPEALAAPGR